MECCETLRGHYMPVRGYGFYLRLFNSRVEREKVKFISTSRPVICLLCKHTNNDVFDDFPKISTTFRRFSKTIPKTRRTFPNIFRRFPKITDDFRGGTDDISIIQRRIWVLFKRECSYSNSNLKTWEINMLSSRVKICLHAKDHLVIQWSLHNKLNCSSSSDPSEWVCGYSFKTPIFRPKIL